MFRLAAIVLLLAACATTRPAEKTTCQLALERCNNACFKAPRYLHNGPQCTTTAVGMVCPQENQLIDTVEAGKCFEKCEWDAKLCR